MHFSQSAPSQSEEYSKHSAKVMLTKGLTISLTSILPSFSLFLSVFPSFSLLPSPSSFSAQLLHILYNVYFNPGLMSRHWALKDAKINKVR